MIQTVLRLIPCHPESGNCISYIISSTVRTMAVSHNIPEIAMRWDGSYISLRMMLNLELKKSVLIFICCTKSVAAGPHGYGKIKKISVCIGSTGTSKFVIALPFTERITHVFTTPRIFCEQMEWCFNVPCFIVHFKGMKAIYSLIKHCSKLLKDLSTFCNFKLL